jgi:putative membrane protein
MAAAASLAALHYLALAIGFSALVLRGERIKDTVEGGSLHKVFVADNCWGIAALLWIVTGIMRAFGGYEKGSEYYLHSHWFWIKISLFLTVFTIEFWPMLTFIKWRIAGKTMINTPFDRGLMQRFAVLNRIQVVLMLLIPIAAVCMARGI